MRSVLFCSFLLMACGGEPFEASLVRVGLADEAGAADGAADADAGSVDPSEASFDAGVDVASDAFDAAPCLDASEELVAIPVGTVASASATYGTDAPALSIDGDLQTYWLSTGYSGTLTLQFPVPMALDGVRIAAQGNPAGFERYTITPMGSSIVIGQASRAVGSSPTVEDAIFLVHGSYGGIVIGIDMSQSWVAINEVTLVVTRCH